MVPRSPTRKTIRLQQLTTTIRILANENIFVCFDEALAVPAKVEGVAVWEGLKAQSVLYALPFRLPKQPGP